MCVFPIYSKKHKKNKKRKHEDEGEGSSSQDKQLIEEDSKKHGNLVRFMMCSVTVQLRVYGYNLELSFHKI